MDDENQKSFNWPILGHENIIRYLQRLIEKENFIHTYLFTGPRDIGKKTVSNFFVQSIFCLADINIPCKICINCVEIEKHIHPDFIYVNLEEGKKNISIDQVRLFQEKMRLTPMRSKFKIGIINRAATLTTEASNALLKTIEEPPKNSIVILIAEKIENILPTIVSRAQNIIFNNVSNNEICNYLKDLGASSDLAKELADFSGGAPGVAINYFKNLDSWKQQKDELKKMLDIIDNSISEKFSFVDEKMKFSQSSENSYSYFEDLLNSYIRISRDLILFKISSDTNLIHSFLKNSIADISKNHSFEEIMEFYKNALNGKKMIFKNINPKIILENLLLI